MAKIKITEKQAALVKITEKQDALLKKSVMQPYAYSMDKTTKGSVGLTIVRVVVSGENLIKFKDRVLHLITRRDPESTVLYFEKTGNIVGNVKKAEIPALEVELKELDPTITIIEKPKVKSLGNSAGVSTTSVSEDEETGVKSVGAAIGERVVRVVISGPELLKLKDRVLALITRLDPEARVAYFEKTGKIVGNVKSIRLDAVMRDLKSLDPTIDVEEKPIIKSLKEVKKKIKLTKEQHTRAIDNMLKESGVVGGLDRVDKTFKKAFTGKSVENLKEGNGFNLSDIISKYIKDPNDIEAELQRYHMMGFDGLSVPLQANLTRDMDFISFVQSGSDEDQLRREIGEDTFSVKKPNTSVPKLDKSIGHREPSMNENENTIKPEIDELIKFLYGKTNHLSSFWEENGLSYSKIINILFKKQIILRQDGYYVLSKALGTPEAAVQAVETALSPMITQQEVAEDKNLIQQEYEEQLAARMFNALSQETFTPSKDKHSIENIALRRMMNDGLVEYDTEVDHDDNGRAIGAQDFFWFNERGLAEIKSPKDMVQDYFYSDHDDDGGEAAYFSAASGGVDEITNPADHNPEYTKPTIPKVKVFGVVSVNPEIAILKNAKGEYYLFSYSDLSKKDFAEYAEIEKEYVGKDDEGQPDFEYSDDWDIDGDVISNYVNDNLGNMSMGVGLEGFEDGATLVKIDKPLKDELIKLFDKDKTLVTSLAAIQEDIKSPEEVKPALSKAVAPPTNPVKRTPEAIKAAIAKKREEELKRRKEKGEIDEMTGAASSGAFTGPMNAPVIKREITTENTISKPLAETTAGNASVGPYDANALPNIGRNGEFKAGKKTKAQVKTQYPKGGFVEFDDCTKLNNNKAAQNGKCSVGAVDNVVKVKSSKKSVISPSLDENAIVEIIAKETGKTIEEVKNIIKTKIKKSN